LVKYQVITEFVFFRKEALPEFDLELLTLLAVYGPMELPKFCNLAVKQSGQEILPEDFAVKAQNVRNKITKLEKRGLIKKSEGYKKSIEIASSVPIHKSGNLLLDYKFLAVETN
jgi:hypothetical protein